MNKILSDVRAFGLQFLRTKIGAFFTFIFPVLLILLFGAVFSAEQGGTISLRVQNLDSGPHSLALLDVLNQTGYFEVSMVEGDVGILDYMNENSVRLALYIPPGFSEAVANGTPETVVLYGDPTQSTFGAASGVLSAAISQMNYALSGASETILLSVENPGVSSFEAYDFLLPGFVGLTVMITTMYFMTSTCAEHRSRGYFRLLATTTLTKSEWLSSKFIFNSIVLILSLLITFTVASLMFDLKAVLTPMALVLVVVGAFMFTSMGMLLGIIVRDPESAAAVSNAIGFPMMFLSGSFWDLSASPAYLQLISKAMPLTYLNDGLRDTMVFGNEASAAMNMLVIAALGLVFFVLGSRWMSWKER